MTKKYIYFSRNYLERPEIRLILNGGGARLPYFLREFIKKKSRIKFYTVRTDFRF